VQLHLSSQKLHKKRLYGNTENINTRKEFITMKYVCPCGYEYDPKLGDPENGIAPGTAWEDVPADFVCPVCGLDKDAFEVEE
jgi:rubredoxin